MQYKKTEAVVSSSSISKIWKTKLEQRKAMGTISKTLCITEFSHDLHISLVQRTEHTHMRWWYRRGLLPRLPCPSVSPRRKWPRETSTWRTSSASRPWALRQQYARTRRELWPKIWWRCPTCFTISRYSFFVSVKVFLLCSKNKPSE